MKTMWCQNRDNTSGRNLDRKRETECGRLRVRYLIIWRQFARDTRLKIPNDMNINLYPNWCFLLHVATDRRRQTWFSIFKTCRHIYLLFYFQQIHIFLFIFIKIFYNQCKFLSSHFVIILSFIHNIILFLESWHLPSGHNLHLHNIYLLFHLGYIFFFFLFFIC